MSIKLLRAILAFVVCAASTFVQAASPFAGFYVGQIYNSISGSVTVPERPIGAVAFTVGADGTITSGSDLSGTVTDAGAITWNPNSTGFTTGNIGRGVISATTSVNNNGAISTFRIEAKNTGPGIGQGNALAGRITQASPSQALRRMNRVRFVGNHFVAVGAGGAFATSHDGLNWTRVGVPTVLDLYDVAYGNGRYVVVGDSGARFWSSNGVDWVSNPAGNFPVSGVAFGNGKFVTMVGNGTVSSSADGVAWTPGPALSGGFSSYSGIDFLDTEFVAWAGDQVAFSADASNWTTKAGSTGVGNIIISLDKHQKVAQGNGVYLVGGPTGLASSSNGTTWTKLTSAPGVFFGNIATVSFGNGKFVVCDTADVLWISTDARQWTRVDQLEFHSIAYGAGRFVAVGSDLGTSVDGSLWALPEDDDLRADLRESGFVNPLAETDLVGQFMEGSVGTYSYGRNGSLSWYKHQFANGSGVAPQLTTETLRFAMNMRFGEAPVVVVGSPGTELEFAL